MTGARAAGPAPSSQGSESDTLMAYGPILTADEYQRGSRQVATCQDRCRRDLGLFAAQLGTTSSMPLRVQRGAMARAARHVGRNHFQAFPFADVLARLNQSGPVTMSPNLKRIVAVCGVCRAAGVRRAPPPLPHWTRAQFFEARVRPLLAEHCFSCHGPRRQRAGLRLDSREALLQGSENGPVVTAGKPDESALILAIRHEGEVKMPPKGKLPPEAVAVLTTWVTMGAPWPDTPAGAATTTDHAIAAARKNHWAFRPVQRPVVPAVDGANGALTEIDHFYRRQIGGEGPPVEPDRRSPIADPPGHLRSDRLAANA